jgi:hypothetical protein
MADQKLTLALLPGTYAVCRLDPNQAVPDWASGGPFLSLTRTAEELSLICQEDVVPEGIRREPGWQCLRVVGTLDFSLVGVLASLLMPLAEAGVSVFTLSTFDTDYVLVKEKDLDRTVEALLRAGHSVRPDVMSDSSVGRCSRSPRNKE